MQEIIVSWKKKIEKKTNVTPYIINYESNQLGTTWFYLTADAGAGIF